MCSGNVVRPQMRRPGGTLEGPMSKKKKKSNLGYVSLKFQPLETWTHEMCVLGRCFFVWEKALDTAFTVVQES